MKKMKDISNGRIVTYAGLIALAIGGGYFPDPSADPVDFWCFLAIFTALAGVLFYLAWCLNSCQNIESDLERNQCRANCISIVTILYVIISLSIGLICWLLS